MFKNGARRDDRANNEGVARRCEANRWEQPISHLTGGDSGDFWVERQDRANWQGGARNNSLHRPLPPHG